MRLTLTGLEREILKKHDPGVRARALIELLIVSKFVEIVDQAGYTVKIVEQDDEDMASYGGSFLRALFDLDDAHVNVFDGNKRVGWVYFVFGNDGWDCVSDYSTSLDTFLKPVHELVDLGCN